MTLNHVSPGHLLAYVVRDRLQQAEDVRYPAEVLSMDSGRVTIKWTNRQGQSHIEHFWQGTGRRIQCHDAGLYGYSLVERLPGEFK